jgi:hypothetical protein
MPTDPTLSVHAKKNFNLSQHYLQRQNTDNTNYQHNSNPTFFKGLSSQVLEYMQKFRKRGKEIDLKNIPPELA